MGNGNAHYFLDGKSDLLQVLSKCNQILDPFDLKYIIQSMNLSDDFFVQSDIPQKQKLHVPTNFIRVRHFCDIYLHNLVRYDSSTRSRTETFLPSTIANKKSFLSRATILTGVFETLNNRISSASRIPSGSTINLMLDWDDSPSSDEKTSLGDSSHFLFAASISFSLAGVMGHRGSSRAFAMEYACNSFIRLLNAALTDLLR